MLTIKKERAEDHWEVENLFDLSFAPGRQMLSSYRLREGNPPVADLCFVARAEMDALVGAIRFYEIEIGPKCAKALLLGPIAVHPTVQGEGVGGELIRNSLDVAKENGWERVILIGDLPYYKRFGFERAESLIFPPPTNPERLLQLSLVEKAFAGVEGDIKLPRFA